jgi:hypothetical protein
MVNRHRRRRASELNRSAHDFKCLARFDELFGFEIANGRGDSKRQLRFSVSISHANSAFSGQQRLPEFFSANPDWRDNTNPRDNDVSLGFHLVQSVGWRSRWTSNVCSEVYQETFLQN